MAEKSERWISLKEAAEYLGYSSPKILYMAVRRIGIPHCKLGKSMRFKLSELDEFMESHRKLSLKDSEKLGQNASIRRYV